MLYVLTLIFILTKSRKKCHVTIMKTKTRCLLYHNIYSTTLTRLMNSVHKTKSQPTRINHG